jgi:hypothetical protein
MPDDTTRTSHLFEDPAHLRYRAEEMRTLADDMREPVAKETMLRLAEEYEGLARRALERAADPISSAPPPK